MAEDVLYNDLNGIRITSKKFYSGDKAYALEKIKQIKVQLIVPHKRLGASLFISGLLLITAGTLSTFGYLNVKVGESVWPANLDFISITIGEALLILAIIRMLLSSDKFVVKIKTVDDKQESIKSDSRKYVAQLAASLKRACYRQRSDASKEGFLITV